ncbi:MAG TPA: protein kinase [Ktedonobacteraceae bacterium]|nr:protein kinase [Ktedonobacteraceae bacterium]
MISTPFCPVCGAANEPERTHCFACGEALVAGGEEKQALLHDRYQPGVLLGSGGFSVVYHARDMREGGRDVAIKQINLQRLSAEETIEATDTFNREVQLLSSLSHPQVPWLYDHFGDSGHWYLVLEYLEGSTLEDYLARRMARDQPVRVEEALTLVWQLCDVLEYLHTRQPPVIFRDLKPGNIIRSPSGKLSLIDFGIARRFRPGQQRDTQRLGSPGYAAPEQYGRAQTTPRADIYSLGALLYTLLTGQEPATQPRGLASLPVPGYAREAELMELLQRMLAPDPQERPASASEVAEVLRRLLQGREVPEDADRIWIPPVPQELAPAAEGSPQVQMMLPAPAPQLILPVPAPRTTRRNVLLGLGGVTAMLVGGELLWRTMTSAHPFPLPAIPGGGRLYTYKGHCAAVWSAAWSPNGRSIASGSLDRTVQVWDAFNGGNPFVHRGHAGGIMHVAWSPDGQRIASASEDTSVRLWNARDDGNLLIYQKHTDSVQEANWSPDGRLLVSCSLDGTAQVWQASNGTQVGTYLGHGAGVYAAKWSPDGRLIASSSADQTVQIWDAVTFRSLVVYRGHTAPISEIVWSPDGTRIASASDDGTVQIWNASSGNTILTYNHAQAVKTVAWSPDGSWIASGGDDNTVRVWDADSGTQVLSYAGHQQPIIEINWSPDGSMLDSASVDQSVQIIAFSAHRGRRHR